MTSADPRRLLKAPRVTLAYALGDDGIDGAWWPHTIAVARELPGLIEAVGERLGHIGDIRINWSATDGVLDLDQLTRRGVAAIPGLKARRQRVITIAGDKAQANLLVVPSGTSPGLATLVLRRAASLPILSRHLDTAAYQTANEIVRSAAAECASKLVENS
jgi:hypothetical protein